jgi:hypothetical protein
MAVTGSASNGALVRKTYESLQKVSPDRADTYVKNIVKTQASSSAPKTTTTSTKSSSSSSSKTDAPKETAFSLYKADKVSAPNPVLMGIEELAAKYGGITYNQDEILKIFNDAAKAAYEADQSSKQQEIDNYTRGIGQAARAMGQEMARSRASGVMGNANAGLNAASDLNAMTTFEQATAEDTLTLLQEYFQLEQQYHAALAQNTQDALEYANEIKQAMATIATQLYGADVQKYAAQLGYNAAIEEANVAASASHYATDTNAATARYTVDQQADAARAAAAASANAASRQAASYEYQTLIGQLGGAYTTYLNNTNDPKGAAEAAISLLNNVLNGIKMK